jgi:uncharacterized protein
MSFSDKHLVFGGAGPGTPWGTLGEITRQALAPAGYEVRIDAEASRGRCPQKVTDGKVDFGATQALLVRWAYAGQHQYAAQGPLPRLRVIATIMMPVWLGIAARWDLGITDLQQVADRKLPVRVLGGTGEVFRAILGYYGLTREKIESWGGKFLSSLATTPGHEYVVAPQVRSGDVDVILDNVYAAYTPEAASFVEASVLLDLRFLDLPLELAETLCTEFGGEPGMIPYRLLRGVDRPVQSVSRPWQLIFGRDDMPEEFAYQLAEAYDHGRHLFRQTHIPYSYDSVQVARDHGIPLHPGAERYYRERGYLA